VRHLLARRRIRAIIPRRSNRRPGGGRYAAVDRAAYRERNRVGRLVKRIKQHQRVATRYAKRARHDVAMPTRASALVWL
jgi:transposase